LTLFYVNNNTHFVFKLHYKPPSCFSLFDFDEGGIPHIPTVLQFMDRWEPGIIVTEGYSIQVPDGEQRLPTEIQQAPHL
jgi:hypothetical protein